ncbi:MAG: hypothetical protein WA838_02460 [Xanthobacteraceae bacterium]
MLENLALPTHSENAYCFPGFAGHQKMPMWKLSATTKATRAILFATLASLFANPPLSSMAEQSAGQQSTVAAPAGALKATVRTYQSGNPSAVYRYYWWRDSCYVRYQSDNYELVSPEYCHQQP